MSHRVRNVLGYHGNELGRYQLLGGFAEQWRQLVNPNFWHLMNVRFVLTDAEDLGVAGFNRVVGPVQNAYGTTVYLYQLSENYPAAFVDSCHREGDRRGDAGHRAGPALRCHSRRAVRYRCNGEGCAAHVAACPFAREGPNDALRSRRDRRRAGPARRRRRSHSSSARTTTLAGRLPSTGSLRPLVAPT